MIAQRFAPLVEIGNAVNGQTAAVAGTGIEDQDGAFGLHGDGMIQVGQQLSACCVPGFRRRHGCGEFLGGQMRPGNNKRGNAMPAGEKMRQGRRCNGLRLRQYRQIEETFCFMQQNARRRQLGTACGSQLVRAFQGLRQGSRARGFVRRVARATADGRRTIRCR